AFDVNAEQWLDHATAVRHAALPGTGPVRFHSGQNQMPDSRFRGRVWLPEGGVLTRTISLRMDERAPDSARKVETQILHFDGDEIHAYTYLWDDTQSDAELVPAEGAEAKFTVRDPAAPGGRRAQTWHFHGRGECLRCHNSWADYALAFRPEQLD